jgi:hypothetical protein
MGKGGEVQALSSDGSFRWAVIWIGFGTQSLARRHEHAELDVSFFPLTCSRETLHVRASLLRRQIKIHIKRVQAAISGLVVICNLISVACQSGLRPLVVSMATPTLRLQVNSFPLSFASTLMPSLYGSS